MKCSICLTDHPPFAGLPPRAFYRLLVVPLYGGAPTFVELVIITRRPAKDPAAADFVDDKQSHPDNGS